MFLKLFSKSKPPPPDDLELINQYRQTGNLDLIGLLFERYTEMVYLVCFKYLKDEDESKDAAMQIFETLVQSLRKHEVSNFKSWLHATAKNHCLMQLRYQKTKDFKNNSLRISDEAVQNSLVVHLSENEAQETEITALQEGLTEIPPDQRRCVELFYLQQKCYKEIAEIMGYDVNKVRSHIQNGRRNLKIYLEKNHEAR